MKQCCLVVTTCLLCVLTATAQNLAVNTDGSLANPNAILDIKSGNKGILIPAWIPLPEYRSPMEQ